MANLPETPTYGAGIYQLEVVDPVLGGPTGISNTQAQQIANRTAYLKQHMDSAESNITNITSTLLPAKAPLASPALTGTPTAPTAANGTNTTQIATTAFVTSAISNITGYAPLASPAFTGNPTAPTPTAGDNDTSIATTAFVTTAIANINLSGYAPLASPAFTGNPTAPTPTAGDNDTSIATTAFVTNAVSTSAATKWTKAGDTATGAHGINVAPVTNTGLTVQSDNPDVGFALRVMGDMRVKPAATQTLDQALLYFQNKAGTWGSAMGLQTNDEVIRWYNNAGANVALIDNNGNFIGGNLEAGGTWTPVIAGQTTAGVGTYTEQRGSYCIVGNTVTICGLVTWTAHTGTGQLIITGLPVASKNLTNLYWFGDCQLATSVANQINQVQVYPGVAYINLMGRTVTGTGGFGRVNIMSANTLAFSITYQYR